MRPCQERGLEIDLSQIIAALNRHGADVESWPTLLNEGLRGREVKLLSRTHEAYPFQDMSVSSQIWQALSRWGTTALPVTVPYLGLCAMIRRPDP